MLKATLVAYEKALSLYGTAVKLLDGMQPRLKHRRQSPGEEPIEGVQGRML